MYKFIITLLIFCFIKSGLNQEFSEDIVIEYPIQNQAFKSRPSIDLDSSGNPSVAWSAADWNNNYVKFANSFNHGSIFDTVIVVDTIPLDPNGGFTQIPLVKYDLLNNPSLCSYNWSWTTGNYPMKVDKSFDGGITFPQSLPLSDASSNMIDVFYLDDTTGFIGYHSPDNKIKILRTQNNGLTFSPISSIDPGGLIAAPLLSFVKCNNGEILVFWTGINTNLNTQTLFINRSIDSCKTFFSNSQVDTTLIFSSNGAVSSYKNFIFLAYIGRESGSHPKLLFRKSFDNGYTFSQEKILYEFPSGFSRNPGVALKFNPNVGICITWGHGIINIFMYSNDYGETFSQPVNVTSNSRAEREYRSLAVSDSGYIYVVSKIDTNYGVNDRIVLNRAKLPLLSAIDPIDLSLNSSFELFQNYPNPFNSETTIKFRMEKTADIKLDIFDITGKHINRLLSGVRQSGAHKVVWQGVNDNDQNVASGIYFCTIKSKGYQSIIKLLLIK